MGQNIIYVNVNVSGGANNGTSWANAYKSLSTAINASASGKQIWVARGTYEPSSIEFSMKEGVAIYGGFAGTEIILEQRDYITNLTKLTDRGYNTVQNYFNGLTAAAILDGFTITNRTKGSAGMYNVYVSPTIRNCVFVGNLGDGMGNRVSSPIIINCLFTGNSDSGIYNENNSSPTIINTTIAANNGSALFSSNSTPVLHNSIVWGGTVGSYTASHSLIKGVVSINNGNIDATPYNETDIFSDYTGGDYKLKFSSPAINAGSNNLYTGLGANTLDLLGNPRVYDYAAAGKIDLGAYEYQGVNIYPSARNILYVNGSVSGGTGSGNSWANAVTDLAAAINASASGDQIWVAKGTYQPASGTSFTMKAGVAIYGGFVGTETALNQRNYNTNPTILRGNGNRIILNYDNHLTSTAILDGFTLTGGSFGGSGGAIYNSNTSPTIANCIITGNSVSITGGGMLNYTASPTITGCLFFGNSANAEGGAIFNASSSSPIIINTTIASNSGNALYNAQSTPLLYNSIVWDNVFGGYTASYSLIKDKTDTSNGNVSSNGLAATDIFNNYSNGDYTLKSTSPVLNKGSNSLYTELSANTLDLAGNKRLISKTIDLGPYENQTLVITPDANNIVYVNISADGTGNGSSWTNAIKNLADALKYAHLQSMNNNAIYATNPLKIYVAGGTYKPLYSPGSGNFGVAAGRDNAFLLVPNVQVYGGFSGNETSLAERNWKTNKTILSGDLDNNDILNNGISTTINGSNAYHVVLSGGDMGSAILDGFTVTGGSATGTGNLYVASGLNNYAQDFSRTDGAGIYNRDSGGSFPAPTIRNCHIAGNHAGNIGGGMANYNSSPVVFNCIISNNSAVNAAGGLRNSGNAATKITGSLIYGNTAPLGGGISNTSSNRPILTNCTIVSNGQGLNNGGQEVLLYNTIVWDEVVGVIPRSIPC